MHCRTNEELLKIIVRGHEQLSFDSNAKVLTGTIGDIQATENVFCKSFFVANKVSMFNVNRHKVAMYVHAPCIVSYHFVISFFISIYLHMVKLSIVYTGWARKKFPLLKIHNTKTTTRIWIIQILVKSRKIKVFLRFFSLTYQR